MIIAKNIHNHDNTTNIGYSTLNILSSIIHHMHVASIQLIISFISILFVFSGDFTSTLVVIEKVISHSFILLINLIKSSLSFRSLL